MRGSRSGYFGGGVGQRSTVDISEAIELEPSLKVAGIVLKLWRGASVAGHVELAPGLRSGGVVWSARINQTLDQFRLIPGVRTVPIDQTGSYTFAGLAPGRYLICASGTRPARSAAFSPIPPPPATPGANGLGIDWEACHQQAPSVVDADILTVAAGMDYADVEIAAPNEGGRRFFIAGQIAGFPRGADVHVQLVTAADGRTVPAGYEVAAVPVLPDGSFRFQSVPPGPYEVRGVVPALSAGEKGTMHVVHSGLGLAPAPNGTPLEPVPVARDMWFRESVVVADRSIDSLVLALSSGSRIAGTVLVRPDLRLAPSTLPTIGIVIRSFDGWRLDGMAAGRIEPDGSFITPALPPGKYEVVPYNSSDWYPETALLAGRDLKWRGIEIANGDVLGLQFALTSVRAQLRGTVRNASGTVQPDATIVVLPQAEEDWRSGSVRLLRPNRSGQFIVSVPAADYLVVAVGDDVSDQWQDRSFLRQLAARARKVSLAHGDLKTEDLLPVSIHRQ